jgi:hypothetical protein
VSPRWRRPLLGLALFALVSALCWSLRGLRMEGGDTELFLRPDWYTTFVCPPTWTFFFREPLSFFAPQIVERLTDSWPSADVYALPSCLAGGLFAVALLAISRRPLLWAIMLSNATVFLFLGHIENYALAYVMAVITVVVGWRCAVDRRRRLWPAVACWCLAMAFHQVTAFLAPAALALLFERREGKWRVIPRRRGDFEIGLLCLIALAIFYVIPPLLMAGEIGPVVVYGSSGSIWEFLTPLSEAHDDWITEHSIMGSWARYTMLSAKHWHQMLIFQAALCPLGLISLAVMLARRRGRSEVFLALACGSMLLWSFVWHPHMGWNDFDLWSLMAAPINLTAALLWSGELTSNRESPQSLETAPNTT